MEEGEREVVVEREGAAEMKGVGLVAKLLVEHAGG